MHAAISTAHAAGSSETTFNTSKGHYEHPSLSSRKEDANEVAIGIPPISVECSLAEIKADDCQLGGRTHKTWEPGDRLHLTEPIPEQKPPLHGATGCVYCDVEHASGWETTETDGRNLHPHSRAFYLSHARDVDVFTRQCSMQHPECDIGYTGRSDGFHRDSHDSMVRHEVLLMYWHITKTMHGPGVQSYGSMVQEIYRLAGGTREVLQYNRTLFMEVCLLRRCVFGFLARQRRVMNKRCPMCPDGCPHLTYDAKKLRHPVHLSEGGLSPEQITAQSPKVNCGARKREDRLFWGGAKLTRESAHSLAAAVLGKKLRKGERHFSLGQSDALITGSPEGYKGAIRILINQLKCMRPGSDADDGGSGADDMGSGEGESSSSESDGYVSGGDGGGFAPERPQKRLEIGASPASRAGLCVGDRFIKVGDRDVSQMPFVAVVAVLHGLPCDTEVVFRMRRGSQVHFDATFQKLYDGGLCMDVKEGAEGSGAVILQQYPKPAGLHRELAHQVYWMTHQQCEATQWLTAGAESALSDFLCEYDKSSVLYSSTAWNLRPKGLRASIGRLIDESRVGDLTASGKYSVHPAALSFLRAMLSRARQVRASLLAIPGRETIPAAARPCYNPSTGVAYHFTKLGERLCWWPDFKTQSDGKCRCRKPDWMRSSPNGLSEGVLTVMCLRSGVVLGNTMLTGHEGCKDGAAALYSFHPDLSKVKSVVCDTPCLHSTYVNTRCGADFSGVQWTGDRFHIKAHTCRGIFCPDEFHMYDRTNTSMIEQWHSVMDCLTRTVKGSTLCHAMLLLQTIQDDHYITICKKAGVGVRMWE